ncbi:MAG: element excision factor XisH family protein, partial [Cyanobacteria bacterium J06635_10]
MAKDRFHYVVRKVLEKDGWEITADLQFFYVPSRDPYVINIDDVDFEIDLAAEELLGAEKQGQK